MKHLLILFITLTAAQYAGSLHAAELNDDPAVQEVREVLNDVWEKWDAVDPDHHTHFSNQMMRIRADIDPTSWTIGSSNLMSREQFVEYAGTMATQWGNSPDWQKKREILHVHVNGEGALVTARQSNSMPDSTKRITVNNTATEVVLLRKVENKWRLTHSLVVNWEQDIWHWDPE